MTRYSKDLRERAIKYLLSGHSYRETAKPSASVRLRSADGRKCWKDKEISKTNLEESFLEKSILKNLRNILMNIPTRILEK